MSDNQKQLQELVTNAKKALAKAEEQFINTKQQEIAVATKKVIARNYEMAKNNLALAETLAHPERQTKPVVNKGQQVTLQTKAKPIATAAMATPAQTQPTQPAPQHHDTSDVTMTRHQYRELHRKN